MSLSRNVVKNARAISFDLRKCTIARCIFHYIKH